MVESREMGWVILLVTLILVVSVVSIILVAISILCAEPVIPRTALRRSATPIETLPVPLPVPVPRAPKHPTPQPETSNTTSTIIRTPTSPRQVRRTPRSVVGGVLPKMYMLDNSGEKLRLLPDVTEPIIDVTYFRNGLLVLLAYGNLVYLTKDRDEVLEYQLPATENITHIVSFDEKVIGLSEAGKLFQFEFFNEDNYSWERFLPNVNNILYINGTQAGDALWVQSANHGVVYDTTYDVVERKDLPSNTLRVYGTDSNEYIEIDRSATSGVVYSSGGSTRIGDVYDGAWRDHQFVKVAYSHYLQGVQRVRTIGGNLYYIIAT